MGCIIWKALGHITPNVWSRNRIVLRFLDPNHNDGLGESRFFQRNPIRDTFLLLLRLFRPSWRPLASLSLPGQEHGRTIPLADRGRAWNGKSQS